MEGVVGSKHIACPVHGGKDGFRFFSDADEKGGAVCNTCGFFSDGYNVVRWRNGWDYGTIRKETALWLGLESLGGNQSSYAPPPPSPAAMPVEKKSFDEAQAARLQGVIDGGYDLTAPVSVRVRKYLGKRGIWVDPLPSHDELFFNPRTPRGQGTGAAMIAMVRNVYGEIVTLHRTFITEEGTKDGDNARFLMTPAQSWSITGSAIRLFPAQSVVALSEGIETALAVRSSTGLPVWATVSAAMLKTVRLPDSIRKVYLFGDSDRLCAGQEAVAEAACRFEREGRSVEIYLPTGGIPEGQKSLDWNDIWRTQGRDGFPRLAI
jgi:hypothetical protein